jgi:hypothetical protein
MADEKQSGEMVTLKDDVWMMDVDTFVPKPDGYVKIKGTKYPIFSFLDVEVEDSLKVSRLGDDIRDADDYSERLERSIEQIMLLNSRGTPKLTRAAFKGISPRQVLTLTVLASSIAKVPLKAAESQGSAEGGSPSPSPASAASMDGGEGSSSN